MTAGPASGTAWPSTKKMPVPIVAPTPNIVSWNVPIVRSSRGPCGSALSPTGLRRHSSPRNPVLTVEVLIRLPPEVVAPGHPGSVRRSRSTRPTRPGSLRSVGEG
ncbi:MAG: hypothetical protein ACRYG2_10075 [Janthinobacterium lividum]